jgi:hypothetical protein
VSKIPLDQLRQIIWEVWQAVPDSFIEKLIDSWWDRCQAVINAILRSIKNRCFRKAVE